MNKKLSGGDSVRLGVIGLGNIARQHIQHVLNGHVPHCEITAVCGRSSVAAPEGLSVMSFSDYRALIDSGLCDAILVATPTFHHYEAGEYALNAGLHLLMEKPIGLSVAEGEKLLQQAKAKQVFAVMLNQRVDPVYKKMRELIQGDAIGELTRCSWTMTNWFRPEVYFQVSDWRATWKGEGGGLLVNQCIHNLDILQWLCGMPKSLQAFCHFGKYHDIEVEDEASCFFEYESGASGVFTASSGEAPGFNRLEVVGNKGYLTFDGQTLLHGRNSEPTDQYSRTTRDMFGAPETRVEDITPLRDVNQHAAIISNFCEAIRNDHPLIAPAKAGLNSLALANGMLMSTWLGERVHFPLDSAQYQQALEQRIAGSGLREKAAIDVNVDMNKSYK